MKLGLVAVASLSLLLGAVGVAAADEMPLPPADADASADFGDLPGTQGWALGLRTGYALPFGNVSGKGGAGLAHLYDGAVPVWVDIGYRSSPHFYAGIYFQYAPTVMSTDLCGPDMHCHGSDVRFGLDAQYHFVPGGAFDPWVGVGAGFELANAEYTRTGQMSAMTVSGFEIANVQLGGDFTVGKVLKLGPFAAATLGDYSTASLATNGALTSGGIDDQALHTWFMLGIRGQYDL
jgi:hypothetical protein